MRWFPVDEPPGTADDSTDQREWHAFQQRGGNIFTGYEDDDEPEHEAKRQPKQKPFTRKNMWLDAGWLPLDKLPATQRYRMRGGWMFPGYKLPGATCIGIGKR